MSEEKSFTQSDMHMARDAGIKYGVRLGLAAAAKAASDCGARSIEYECADTCAAAIRAIDPERVAEGKP